MNSTNDASEADFNHLALPKPCRVVTTRYPIGWVVRCEPHDCEADRRFGDQADAIATFRCDRGRRWRFIVHHLDDQPPPVLVDLTELAEEITAFVHNESAGSAPDVLVVWRYLLDGTCQKLHLSMDDTGHGEVAVCVHAADAPPSGHPAGYTEDATTYLVQQIILDPDDAPTPAEPEH